MADENAVPSTSEKETHENDVDNNNEDQENDTEERPEANITVAPNGNKNDNEGEDNDADDDDEVIDDADDDNNNIDEDLDDDEDDDDMEDNPLAHLPKYVLERVEKLQVLHKEHEDIEQRYLQERAALEKKFEALMKPLYDNRASIIRGDMDKEISEKAGEMDVGDTNDRVAGIPQFWACAMTQMDTVGEIITEQDVDCLEHLQNIVCEDREDGMGFTLKFYFGPNDYFTNNVLTKVYEVPNMLLSDEPILKNVVGTTIDWKPDRDLTHITIKKKQRGKGKNAGQVRTVTKKEEKESFFHWFSPPKMPSMETMDEEEAERLEELFENDYDVAQAFRGHVIPKAVKWFSGEAGEEVALSMAMLAEHGVLPES